MIELNREAVLAALQQRYHVTLAETVSAKAHYFTLKDDCDVSAAALAGAYLRWKDLDARRRSLAVRVASLQRDS